jgi:hypothetical protein
MFITLADASQLGRFLEDQAVYAQAVQRNP